MSTVDHGLFPGDIVLACDFGEAAVFQVTNAQPGINDNIVHNDGTTVVSPGNCSKGLGFGSPVNCTANGNQYAFGCYQGKYSGAGCDGDEDGIKNEPEDSTSPIRRASAPATRCGNSAAATTWATCSANR